MDAGAVVLIQGLRDYGGLLGLSVATTIVAAVAFYRYNLRRLEKGFDFLWIRAALADEDNERWLARYRSRLSAVLDRLDAWFGPGRKDIPIRPNLARIPLRKVAPLYWSAHAFGVHLTLAVVYPQLLLLLFWGIGGINTSGMSVLHDNIAPWWRYAVLTGPIFLAVGFYYYLLEEQDGWKDIAWLIGAAALAVVGVVYDVLAVVGASGVAIVIPHIIAEPFLAFIEGIGIVIMAGIFPIALVLASTFASTLTFVVGGILLFIFTYTSVGTLVLERLYDFLRRTRWKSYQLWMVFILACFAMVVIGFGVRGIVAVQMVIYCSIFFVLLPILNALYDWLSLGLTRYMLRRSLDEGRNFFLYALIDLAAAVILLALLSLTIVAAIAGLNAIAPTDKPPIDLAGILSMLRSDPGNPALWWIYAMIFSTLLPTFFHAGVALTSLPMLRFMPRWRKRIAQRLHEIQDLGDFHDAAVKAALYLTLEKVWMVILAVLALGALTALLLWAVPGFARLLLFLCEETARLLGTDITPGPIAPFIRWS